METALDRLCIIAMLAFDLSPFLLPELTISACLWKNSASPAIPVIRAHWSSSSVGTAGLMVLT